MEGAGELVDRSSGVGGGDGLGGVGVAGGASLGDQLVGAVDVSVAVDASGGAAPQLDGSVVGGAGAELVVMVRVG